MVTVKRISVGSAVKVGALVSLVVTAVAGLCFMLMYGAILSSMSEMMVSFDSSGGASGINTIDPNALAAFRTAGFATLCFGYGILLVFAAIGGGIFGGLVAIAYNLSAKWVGGLEMEVDNAYELAAPAPPPSMPRYNPNAETEKPKRHPTEGFDS